MQTEKVLKVLIESSPKALELFAQEAEVLLRLQTSGVPQIDANGYFHIETLSATSLQGGAKPRQLHCLVMEKIHGHTLEEVFNQNPQGCPQELVLDWLTQAVDILQELHNNKIIHRDIKPSNLMLRTSFSQGGKDDRLVLIDFGGAKQIGSGLFRSQPSTRLYSTGYSPPEQVTGGLVGPGADFYALGRTMIEMLTGQSLTELENPVTGEVRWRNDVNVSPKLADLLDEMIQNDVRSRPASAEVIQKRLLKISRISPQQGFFKQLEQFVGQSLGQISQLLSQVRDFTGKGLAISVQAVSATIVFIFNAIVTVILACLDTIWTMILTGVGASFGAIAGFFLASKTSIDEGMALFLSYQAPEVFLHSQTISGQAMFLFVGAGLGTAWGLTLAGGFGQKRRFLVTSLMGIIGYGFGWLVLQLIAPEDGGEGLVGLILAAVSLLTLSLGLRSHHIVHAVIAAFGTAIVFAALIAIGFPSDVFEELSSPDISEIWLPVVFFGFMGVFLSFWLGVSYYLIVPGLRLLGWR